MSSSANRKSALTRAIAAHSCYLVIDKGIIIKKAIECGLKITRIPLSTQERALVHQLVFGVVRWYLPLNVTAQTLLIKKIKRKDRPVYFLLLSGLYQLQKMKIPEYAAISETVDACKYLHKPWFSALLNACLRQYQRQPAKYDDSTIHPQWLEDTIRQAWPQFANKILQAHRHPASLHLRVSLKKISRDSYLSLLQNAAIHSRIDYCSMTGIVVDHSLSVEALPGFKEGLVSVQDTASQLLARIIKVKPGGRVLDACAAPGGKTAALLEYYGNTIELHAMDKSPQRCQRITQTLQRLSLNGTIHCADAEDPKSWLDIPNQYDTIIIDAPCSASGVIRRHPDILHRKQSADIIQVKTTQARLLNSLWPLVRDKGQLIYCTCSIFPDENHQQIARFLNRHEDARSVTFSHPNALYSSLGRQTLPGVHAMDGFFCSILQKM